MRTGRPKQPLTITEEERERLESLAHRARSQAVLARRARVVLACAEGLDNQLVARKLRCSVSLDLIQGPYETVRLLDFDEYLGEPFRSVVVNRFRKLLQQHLTFLE